MDNTTSAETKENEFREAEKRTQKFFQPRLGPSRPMPGAKKSVGIMSRLISHPEHGTTRVWYVPKRYGAKPKNDQARIDAAKEKRERKNQLRLINQIKSENGKPCS